MKPSIITNQALINQSQPNGQESTNLQRRTVIGGALVALLASPGRVLAKEKTPKDPLVLLLNGPYQEVDGNQPDLGFSKVEVNLHDGTFLTTQIFPVHVEGIPCNANENTPVGKFFAQFKPPGGDLAVYQLPGGAIAMRFLPCGGFIPPAGVDDGLGLGGVYLNGTFELTIVEATGIFRSFEHGHNHMVDRLHQLDNVQPTPHFDEYCFCFITRHGDNG
jgi:hypothetical protein